MKLEISHIRKQYDKNTVALRDVSFTSEKAEFISIYAKSGEGKSSLFRILNGSLKSDEGAFLIDGEDLLSASPKRRRRLQRQIGTIYQDFCLVESMSCIENVLNAALPEMGFFRGIFGIFGDERRKEAMQLLEKVGLEDKPDTPVKDLSGGQKQRVAIARALMQHPGILLADEPVASLDPVTGRKILELLREIQQNEKLTVLMNSHNPALSTEFSDRIIALGGGRVVYDAPASEFDEEKIALIYGAGEKDEA